MIGRTYEEMNAEAMRLYGQQEFAQMLELLNREGDNYPERTVEILYLRSCMAVRVGQPDLALRILQEALDKGLWYGHAIMRDSPSWQSLQGLPEFERMVEICKVREDEARATSRPQLFILEPDGGCLGEQSCSLVISLHGNGANGPQSIDGWRSVVSEGWLLAAPQSSQLVSLDSYIWDDQDTALREVAGHYATLKERYSINPDRVVITGFSMGGETALRVALSGTISVRGFILLGPGGSTINTPEAWLPLIERASTRGLRGYILVGEQDEGIPHNAICTLVEMLNGHGIPCELEMIPGARHEYPPDFAARVQRAIAYVG